VSTPARIGKNEWRATIRSARQANEALRNLLKRIMREGSPMVQALTGTAALEVADLENALSRLEEIGRNTERGEQ
jgi:hypothetical protein